MKSFFAVALAVVVGVASVGCANAPAGGSGPRAGEEAVRHGKVARIDPVELEGESQLGLGAVLGAAVGGIVGNQFGRGSGRDVMTVLGILGGGYIGHKQQNKYGEKRLGQNVVVELSNGVHVGVTQPTDPALRVGDKVRIDGSGSEARVLRE